MFAWEGDVGLSGSNTRNIVAQKRSHRADGLAAAFEAQYFDYQYIFVEFLIGHMVDAARAFDGDYHELLVMAVLGQARLAALRAASESGLPLSDIEASAESTNASRIADITKIPRQTVRRKLASLSERGWVERDAEGAYRLVSVDGRSSARRDLAEPDHRALHRIARLVADLESLGDKYDRPVTRSR